LEEEVARSRFSADLYYRLNVPIVVPALRAHPEDIPLLVAHFVNEFNTEFRKCVLGSTPAACTLLQKYHWPGNVRELRNATERAVLLSNHDHLEPTDFSTVDRGIAGGRFELPAGGLNLETLERDLVIQALRRCG